MGNVEVSAAKQAIAGSVIEGITSRSGDMLKVTLPLQPFIKDGAGPSVAIYRKNVFGINNVGLGSGLAPKVTLVTHGRTPDTTGAIVDRIIGMIPVIETKIGAEREVIHMLEDLSRGRRRSVKSAMDDARVNDPSIFFSTRKSLTQYLKDNLTGSRRTDFIQWLYSVDDKDGTTGLPPRRGGGLPPRRNGDKDGTTGLPPRR